MQVKYDNQETPGTYFQHIQECSSPYPYVIENDEIVLPVSDIQGKDKDLSAQESMDHQMIEQDSILDDMSHVNNYDPIFDY